MEKYIVPYVVIFIPAYNEERAIGKTIKDILEKIAGRNQKDFVADIVVIDDGSTDNTKKIALESGAKRVVSHPENKGLGAATRTGMQTAYEMGADIAVKIDGDFQFDASDIEKLTKPILDDEADCVFGSRFLGNKKYYGKNLYKSWGNKFFAWLISKITRLKITDAATGFMAFHERYLKTFNIIKDYNETQQLIIDSWGKRMRVMEVAVACRKRTIGKSFINLKYPFIVLPTIFRMYIHFKPLRFFIITGLILIILGISIGLSIIFCGETFFGDATIAILIITGVQIIIFGLLADQISYRRK
jgi:glycosyltransferase involved in cell wall biosynthesis